MPIYEFRCTRCGLLQEFLVLLREEMPFCKACNGPLTRLPSAPGLIRTKSEHSHDRWVREHYQPQGHPVTRRPPLPGDLGSQVKIYDMDFGHQERELLARKSEMDNM